MSAPRIPADETARLAALRRYEILDTAAELEFDELTSMVAEMCEMPVSLISLVDHDRQWFKSAHGVDVAEMPRSQSFCGHTILGDGLMEISDASRDPRFADNPLVTGAHRVRFYAGMPLVSSDGHRIGTVCVVDLVPRVLTALQRRLLEKFSRLVMRQLESRLLTRQHRKSRDFIEKIARRVPGMIYQFRLRPDGSVQMPFASAGIEALYGVSAESVREDATALLTAVHPDDRPAVMDMLRHSAVNLALWRMTYRCVLPDGSVRWMFGNAMPEREDDGSVLWHGFISDVTEHRQAEMALEKNREFLKILIDALPVGVSVKELDLARHGGADAAARGAEGEEREGSERGGDEDTAAARVVTYWNPAASRMSRIDGAQVMGRTNDQIFTPQRAAIQNTHEEQVLRERAAVSVPVYPIRFDDGGCSKLRMTTIPLFDERGRISHLLSIAEDITEMLSQQKALRQSLEELGHSERRLRLITDNVPVAITYIDRDMVYRFANATMQDWIAGGVVGVQGRRVAEVLPALEFSERRDYMNEALGGRRVEFDRTPTGDQPRYLHTTYLPDIGDDGQVLGIYTLAADVSVHKRNELSLQKLARFDHLTGLPNRGQLHETLEAMLTRSRRTGTAIAVLFLDIDHFKSINDTLGHARGDEVLKEFARRLQDGVRATDTVARLAGDEFVILLEGLRCLSDADLVAEKILRNVNRPWEFDGAMLGVTTSVGVVCDRSHAHSGDDLIAIADEMLYASKSAGRNTFRVRVV